MIPSTIRDRGHFRQLWLWERSDQYLLFNHPTIPPCPLLSSALLSHKQSRWHNLGNEKSYRRSAGVKTIGLLRAFQILWISVFLDIYIFWIFWISIFSGFSGFLYFLYFLNFWPYISGTNRATGYLNIPITHRIWTAINNCLCNKKKWLSFFPMSPLVFIGLSSLTWDSNNSLERNNCGHCRQ